jgi:hypothetical protein
MSIRPVIFLLGCLLMALGLAASATWPPAANPPRRFDASWLFFLGLALAVAAHGWPEGLR